MINLLAKKKIQIDAQSDEIINFLERYFDERTDEKDFIGHYYKFTIKDRSRKIFTLKKAPLSSAPWECSFNCVNGV